MRLLAVVPLYPPHSLVGAWLATHEHLAYLAAQGHQAEVFAFLGRGDEWEIDGVRVVTAKAPITRSARSAAEMARAADVVIGHCGDGGYAARVAKDAGRPLAQLFHGGHRPPDPTARLVVFNSQASRYSIRWAGAAVVCRPWTDPTKHATTPGDCVTIVNCSREKGIHTAQRAAAQLPHLPFLVVRGGHGTQITPRASNMTIIEPTSDMRGDVWSRTRILLVPSHREAWGLVGVEALASGIPVIASDLPGLRESLDDAGMFLPPHDTRRWVAEIERLHDPAEWQQASNLARKRSAELAADDPRPRFMKAVESLVGVAV